MTYPPSNDPSQSQPPQPGYGMPPAGYPQGYGAPQMPPPGYPQAGYGAPAVTYATWIQRVGAYLIDWICSGVFFFIGALVGRGTDANGLPTVSALYYVFALIGLAVVVYNRWYQAGTTGQSWGKKVVGIRLVGEQTGQPIGFGMAFVRDIAHFVDAVICYIGFLFPLWDDKKQTIADKILKTLVVR